jgi:hypothetical protein
MVARGGTMTTSGSDTIHTFTSSGTFTVYTIGGTATSATNAGTVANDTNIGSVAWVNPTNAQGACDATNATVNLNAGDATISNYLKATNFGFALPSGSTIDGIETVIRIQASANNQFPTLNTRIVTSGTVQTTSTVGGVSQVSSSLADYTFGGPTELYGQSLTESIVENSGFGIAIYITGDADDYYVDCFAMTVYYTPASGGSQTTTNVIMLD